MTGSVLTRSVTVFHGPTNTTPAETVPLATVLDRIRDGTYALDVTHLRQILTTQGRDAYNSAKRRLMAFTPAGVFTSRRNAGLSESTGLVHFDFDHPPHLTEAKDRLTKDSRIAYVFVSPSGDGLKVAVWADGIADDRTYKRAWGTVLAYFERTYPDLAVANDNACKDISRLCFVSHDPELYRNEEARCYAVPQEDAPPAKATAARRLSQPPFVAGASDQARTEAALQVIPADEYEIWLSVGMALHSTGETWARSLWDTWSSRSDKYDPTVQEYKWGSFTAAGGTNIGTIFHLAQQYGYTPPRPAPPVVGGQPGPATPSDQAVTAGTPGHESTPARPDILLNTEMTRIVDETQTALLALPEAPVIYQRARHLAMIARGVKAPKWLKRPPDMPVILDATPARLTELASLAAQFRKYDKRGKRWDTALAPAWVVQILMSRPAWPFPLLEGIISSPTLRPDGSLIEAPGYDSDTGLYLDTNGTTFPPLPPCPSLDDARTAIGALQEAVTDFPFTEKWHFSAALAAMLTLVCRFTVMGNVPLFASRANMPGSGKGLLVDVVSIIGTGVAAPRWAQPSEEDEERKRIMTVALAGYPAIHIDNVSWPFGSPALDMALTAPSFSDRLLSTNESREAPLNMVWFASGNNMQFKGDTPRRVVPIDLDVPMERPEQRTDFAHDPLIPWVKQKRPGLTIAALTIVKAYFTAGCPPQGLTAMGSFEEWSTLIRQALVWAGEADPNEGRKGLEAESDPEYERLAQLLAAWERCYPSGAKTLKEVSADIARLKLMDKPPALPGMPQMPNEYDDLQDALGAFDPKYDGKSFNVRVLGNTLPTVKGRVIAGKRLITAGQSHHAALWQVQLV